MIFSKRTDWDLSENDLALAVRVAKEGSSELVDLTVSNPTVCGFDYDSQALLAPLSHVSALRYTPEPFGMAHAREAVAQYYNDASSDAAPERICLTTSTSEAYSFLFRLLCDTGDEILIAQPSYPLFDFIARLDDIKLSTYSLVYDDSWQIDLNDLESRITPRTKAIVVVHPNNPTGNFASAMERSALDAICSKHDVALIVDEVFLDYQFGGQAEPSFLSSEREALTFVLSGVSKVCALPQMKLSWIVASGPGFAVRSALDRLEVIADTFLSVNAPTQYAVLDWLGSRSFIQDQVRKRTAANMAHLRRALVGTHASCLDGQGGWTAVLRVPRHANNVAFAQAALAAGVIVQPGQFYGLSEGHAVVSLLTDPADWKRGIAKLPIR